LIGARGRNSIRSDAEFEKLFKDEFLLNVDQAAVWLGVSATTLNHWRSDGKGPPFVKLCGTSRGAVRYQVGDIRSWLAGRVVNSASEAMLLDAQARISPHTDDWNRPHPFVVRPHFIVDSAVADRATFVAVMQDPYVKVRWITPVTALKRPWLRSDRRIKLLARYLNSKAGNGKALAFEFAYAQALNTIPERLFGSHPDLTLKELNASLRGAFYPIEFGP